MASMDVAPSAINMEISIDRPLACLPTDEPPIVITHLPSLIFGSDPDQMVAQDSNTRWGPFSMAYSCPTVNALGF